MITSEEIFKSLAKYKDADLYYEMQTTDPPIRLKLAPRTQKRVETVARLIEVEKEKREKLVELLADTEKFREAYEKGEIGDEDLPLGELELKDQILKEIAIPINYTWEQIFENKEEKIDYRIVDKMMLDFFVL